jgi:hypothetical protein
VGRKIYFAVIFAVAFSLSAPALARASSLAVAGGTLTFTPAAGAVNQLDLANGPTVNITVLPGDADPPSPGPGCTANTATTFTCDGVARIVADLGGGDDYFDATDVAVPVQLEGGEGADTVAGGSGSDSVSGGPGEDLLYPALGTDVISGGGGIDRMIFGDRTAISITLDGVANDGGPGEGDNILPDVEDVTVGAAASSTVVLVGSAASNSLDVDGGGAQITGGPGSDTLSGSPLDDTLDARDGYPDRVFCGAGTDTALLDPLDTVASTCENAPVASVPGLEDVPPTVAWTAPAANSFPGSTTLAVNAADDRGVAKVQFYDDDRLLCEDATAPYECPFTARPADVGSNTLIAIAVDGLGQTSSAIRRVTVTKFRPRLSLSLSPSRDRAAPYRFRARGTLSAAPCTGTVTVTATAGSRTVLTRRAKVNASCNYSVTLRFSSRVAARLRVTARYPSTSTTVLRSSPGRTVRLG